MAYDREAVLALVYDRICDGESVEAICAGDDMPNASTVYRWLIDTEKCEEYARAKAVRAERFANKVIETAESEHLKPDDKRVRIDAYKWAAGKLYGKYSEKVVLQGETTVTHRYDLDSLDTDKLEQLETILADAARSEGGDSKALSSSVH